MNIAVISLDLGLYKPAKQLQFSKPECSNKWILRPGELHIVMAQLRTIGAYIDQSGLDEIWLESGIYSATTIKQILEGKNVKRALEAHITMLQALFYLYQIDFFTVYTGLKTAIESLVQKINKAIIDGKHEEVISFHDIIYKN